MVQEGQVVLFRFPQTDTAPGKLRPALVIRRVPGPHDDWLICMVSAQVDRAIPGLDEVVSENDADFKASGLKTTSVVRSTRLAVVEKSALVGAIGRIDSARLRRIRNGLAGWLRAEQ